jgi:hypothetical protein
LAESSRTIKGLQAGTQLLCRQPAGSPTQTYAIAMANLHPVEPCLDHEKLHASSYTEAYACQLEVPGPG